MLALFIELNNIQSAFNPLFTHLIDCQKPSLNMDYDASVVGITQITCKSK